MQQLLKVLFYCFLIIWALAISLLGLGIYPLASEITLDLEAIINLHAQLSIITTIPILLIQLYFLKRSSAKVSEKSTYSDAHSRYAIILWLVIIVLSGLATKMEFFPAFFHKIAVWPFVLYFIWINLKGLLKKP